MTSSREENKPQIGSLIELALHGLAGLYDEQQGLFAFQIRRGRRVRMPPSWSICYTAIALLGLNKARHEGWEHAFDVTDERKTLDSLVSSWTRAKEVGHLGLIQWANAECLGQYAGEVTEAIGKRSSTEALSGLPTMELAWLLSGCCATLANFGPNGKVKELAARYCRAILDNFYPATGLFCHSRSGGSSIRLRSKIGNFADQIYAVLALSLYHRTVGDQESLQPALQCAAVLCSLQGKRGQWWWHYHAPTGIVTSRYPVYSVHQYGMAPMALQELATVNGQDFQNHINRGIQWLAGFNELGANMIDQDRRIIWRDIEQTAPASFARYITSWLAATGSKSLVRVLDSSKSLKVNHEMRPYELGWLLYALPGQLRQSMQDGG